MTAPEFAPHISALEQGRIVFPCCRACGKFHWYPLTRCTHCQSADLEWAGVAGPGEVWSWTIVRRAFDSAWAGEVPYAVALVTFADAPGVRLVTRWVETPFERIDFGLRVVPVFGDRLRFRAA